MRKFIENYKTTLLLLLSMIIGVIVGLTLKNDAKVLSPFGNIFINMLYISIVPLIFLTITSSIAKMTSVKRMGKIMVTIIITFIVTSLVAVFVGIAATYNTNLIDKKDINKIKISEKVDKKQEDMTILERTVSVLTVDDFVSILSKDNIIAILVVSILVGIAINISGKSAEPVVRLLDSMNIVLMNFIKLIMYYAPIGLGCYFAVLVGEIGSSIAIGFLKTFVIYIIVALIYYFVVYTIYAYLAGGRKGVKLFWRNIAPTTLTSLATCSSSATIPVNIESAKKIGVPSDIAETIIPLGTSFHKDGSIIGSVFKIMFLVCLFNTDVAGINGILKVTGVALIANLLVTAVPIGGGTISEAMIISLMGYNMSALPILTIIATIIDSPATMLNVVGDTSSSMIVARVVDGKNWLNNSKEKKTKEKKK